MSKIHVPKYGHPLEHAIVRALLEYMNAKGWVPHEVSVGGDEALPVATDNATIDEVFAGDDAWLCFRNAHHGFHSVYLVLGNGDAIISDWVYDIADADGFNAAMEAFSDLLAKPIYTLVVPS